MEDKKVIDWLKVIRRGLRYAISSSATVGSVDVVLTNVDAGLAVIAGSGIAVGFVAGALNALKAKTGWRWLP